ncbi:MAG: hypothetical protein D8M58_20020 [Calditrichaeota bacterium]|nr:MAG: hypothetical protein DWQ03_14765 [Calditrichota bacterium]MBL1207697.1 hypothetical protein [Calditrichota bacterium]NOG47532.1 hypothetical protein [Calditrichota bacterium]
MECKINDEILDRLKEYQKNTSFKNLEELIEYILEEYLNKNKDKSDGPHTMPAEINQRLKDLGYL